MKVSFIVVAYNEEKTLNKLFNDIVSQDYPHNLIEIILVDGLSTDSTKNIMKDFSKQKNGFSRVIIKDNYKKTLPSGWNVALSEVKGELIIRVDAHSSIPKDFISKNVKCIENGEKICGGYRPNIIDEDTLWKRMLLLAETSMFGSSIAPYRRNCEKSYVNSIFHGAYLKEVFDNVGKYNESLVRTEDNEMHYRMRKAGYKICFNPNIISYQHTRNSLKKMIKQKYLNGYWIGLTMAACPKCFSFYHFVPMLFVISIIITVLLFSIGYPILFIVLASIYGLADLIMSFMAIKNTKFNFINLMLLILFPILHISYGIGTLIGVIKIPFVIDSLIKN